MRNILSEKNIVVALFVMVLITFSLAQEDAKKMERMQKGINTNTAGNSIAERNTVFSDSVTVITDVR